MFMIFPLKSKCGDNPLVDEYVECGYPFRTVNYAYLVARFSPR
jgi:hypothetical protein